MDDDLVSAQPDGCAFGPAPTKSRQSVSCRRTSPAPVNGCAKEKVPGQRFIYCCANDCGRNPAFLRAGFAPAACRANRFRPLRSGNPASLKIHLFQLRFRNTSPPAVDLPADLLRRKIMRRRTVTRTPTRSLADSDTVSDSVTGAAGRSPPYCSTHSAAKSTAARPYTHYSLHPNPSAMKLCTLITPEELYLHNNYRK